MRLPRDIHSPFWRFCLLANVPAGIQVFHWYITIAQKPVPVQGPLPECRSWAGQERKNIFFEIFFSAVTVSVTAACQNTIKVGEEQSPQPGGSIGRAGIFIHSSIAEKGG